MKLSIALIAIVFTFTDAIGSRWPSRTNTETACSGLSDVNRLDCHPEANANQEKCQARGCCWLPANFPDQNVASLPKHTTPMCFFPTDYPAFNVASVQQTPLGYMAELTKSETDFMQEEVGRVFAEVRYESRTRLRIRITMPNDPNRWEPPVPIAGPETISPEEADYKVILEKSPFGLKVVRTDDPNQVLIDSTGPMASSLIIADQFLQMAFRLQVQRGFGLGERRTEFPFAFDIWDRAALWARDNPPGDRMNLYGVHNFFMGLSHDGSAFGLWLLNSNAQEVALTPMPALTYRTIGGILDFFLFTGPRPADVIAQYQALIGTPPLPPYWALGFHLCRYGYKDLAEVSETVKRNMEVGIPMDSQWIDIDYMDKFKDWTVDDAKFGQLGNFVSKTLHGSYGLKSVLIIDPAIGTEGGDKYKAYSDGLKRGIFINDSRTGKPLRGVVWPGDTVFPDFSHPQAEDWWYQLAADFHQNVPFDGLWIDMNEPANFVAGSTSGCPSWNKLDNPPFVPPILDGQLYAKTVCPSALHHNTTHYNRHNLYGYDEARVTRAVLQRLFPNNRPFLLTRSSFAGSGRYTAHWTGDNFSGWKEMKESIAQIINFNMFGIPLVGADICGFNGDATEELCIRWSQLGAFYPFSRNHNSIGSRPQDPAAWSPNATAAIRDAIRLRYFLLPYLYSLFYRAHLNGTTVARSLAFEYPQDLGTHFINEQFMLGSCVLVTPVLSEGRTGVDGYVPSGEWINLSNGARYLSRGGWFHFKAPLQVIPILVRGGCVLPVHNMIAAAPAARKQSLGLSVVLSTTDDGSVTGGMAATASGEMFWDDGDSVNEGFIHVEFQVRNRTLTTNPVAHGQFASNPRRTLPNEMLLNLVLVVGLTKSPSAVQINGQSVPFEYVEQLQTLRVHDLNSFTLCKPITMKWTFS